MRIGLLVILALAAAGYYLFGGRTMTREAVDDYYRRQMHATLSRDPQALCELLADDYVGVAETVAAGQRMSEVVDKKKACDTYRAFYDDIRTIGEAKGGMLRLGYHQDIGDVAVGDDGKSATVAAAYRLTVSGRLMIFDATAVETLIRKRGRVYLQRSESKTIVETH